MSSLFRSVQASVARIGRERVVALRARVRVAGRPRGVVAVHGELDRRLAIAEQVVGQAESWRRIALIRHVGDFRERAGGDEATRRCGLLGHLAR